MTHRRHHAHTPAYRGHRRRFRPRSFLAITEFEFFHSARPAQDRARGIEDLRLIFGWVPVDDRAFDRAWRVQEALTKRGQHRSAGPVDLVVAATAELQGLTLLHRDRDFECIASVTGQALQWYGPEDGK